MSATNMYVAVIGDIIDSRSLDNRNQYQQQFKETLAYVNTTYHADIASRFMVTLGDGFQGLLLNGNNVMNIVLDIEEKMDPLRLRFGIGIGEVSTSIATENSAEIDGPVYHYARQMIEDIERKATQRTQSQSNMMIYSTEATLAEDNLLNAILSLCTAIKSKWSDRQKEIIRAYRANENNQNKTAQALNIAQSSVHRALHSARYVTYATSITTVSTVLKQRWE